MNLGEMSRAQLEEIEILNLRFLEMNKEIELLKNMISDLNRKLDECGSKE